MHINFKGHLVDFSRPKVMGILNLTPDSFYDGNKFNDISTALKQVEKMISEGADFIDIGGYSSKPGAAVVDEESELKRVIPVLEAIHKNFPKVIISIDTFRSKTAKLAVEAGAGMVNDIAAGNLDKQMLQTVSKLKVPYIMMHMQGTPQDMQLNPRYNNPTVEIKHFFSEKIAQAHKLNISDIVIDPGFGFGKSMAHNYLLLKDLALFKTFKVPVLVGLSRKSMIHKVLKNNPFEALNGTSVLNTIALINGANILRVHDVKEAVEVMKLTQALTEFSQHALDN